MNNHLETSTKALFRWACGAIFLYFGVNAVYRPSMSLLWVAPNIQDLIAHIIPPLGFIVILGIIQIAVALALLLGRYVRLALGIAILLLLGIIINLGFDETSLRDFVIMTGMLYLFVQEFRQPIVKIQTPSTQPQTPALHKPQNENTI